MLHALKPYIPGALLQGYHAALARAAAVRFSHPSDAMIVIGVTGTNGKSSTVRFIADLLETLGEKVGLTSTAGFRIAGEEVENRLKMTMPGRFLLQKLLRKMAAAGCGYAIVETSSQGLAQFRHTGINYDVAVFTNLTPEHLEAHGGFEKYKAAKGALFAHLAQRPRKTLRGKVQEKISVVNADDPHAGYFAQFPADRHMVVGEGALPGAGLKIGAVTPSATGAQVLLNDVPCTLALTAEYQWKNAAMAIAVVHALGFPLADVVKAAQQLRDVPGRFERIDAGQPFTVIVDYAYEPYALQALFSAVARVPHGRVIGVHGSAGGGRDVARRPEIGRVAAEHEDIVIITNEDPYDEDPRAIMDAIADGARTAGKREGEDLFIIEDRGEAIAAALRHAQPGDIVLITGKGSEPVMALAGGKKIPWDDRERARQALAGLGYPRV